MKKDTQQLLLMLIIGILIGVTFQMLWRNESSTSESTASVSSATSSVSGFASNNNSTMTTGAKILFPVVPQIPANTRSGLQVKDQTAGQYVTVEGIMFNNPQWIAIYDDQDGHPGFILGSTRFHPGDTQGVVDLLRKTESGKKYYAAILNDDGGETFNRLTDLPPMTPDKIIIVSFVAR